MTSTHFLDLCAERCRTLGPYYEKLRILFSASPYLCALGEKYPELIEKSFNQGFRRTANEHLKSLSNLDDHTDAELMRLLRIHKNQMALILALGDVLGFLNFKALTAFLSATADKAIHITLKRAYKNVALRQKIDTPLEKSGLFVLGLGKLGSYELNYSSDIDLILFYNKKTLGLHNEAGTFFNRVAKQFIYLLHERTADGYVFRVDMRLRPDPLSTPVAMSLDAAKNYYTTLGQNWERAAMIKARPIAGDMKESEDFLNFMHPFIWRTHLDFDAIKEIRLLRHQMLSRFETHDPNPGYNVKLGHGGIRDIEFFIQSQQLIWGGRHVELQDASTLSLLFDLQKLNLISKKDGVTLENAYLFLREIEHRLQMIKDEQTHALPQKQEELLNLAHFCGYKTSNDLLYDIQKHSSAVTLFLQKVTPQEQSDFSLQQLLSPVSLKNRGFKDHERVLKTLQTWLNGDYRATHNEKERAYLERLIPTILETFKNFSEPDEGFFAFDRFLGGLETGLNTLSFFEANPHILEQFIALLASKTTLTKYIHSSPQLIDYFIFSHQKEGKLNPDKTLRKKLKKSKNLEDTLNALKPWIEEQRFMIGLDLFEGRFQEAPLKLTNVAETTLQTICQALFAEMKEEHSSLKPEYFCILGLGSLGRQNMNHYSDLDLIFLYDIPEALEDENSAPVFTKFVKKLITALSTQTSEGPLYHIDMQLRPSGNKGSIISSFEAFKKYQYEDAWVWEHFALTKARVIVGSGALKSKVGNLLTDLFNAPHNQSRTLQELNYFRNLLSPNTKHMKDLLNWQKGGFYELSSILGYLKLSHEKVSPRMLQRIHLTHTFYTHIKVMLGIIGPHYEGNAEQAIIDFPYLKQILNPKTLQKTRTFIHDLYQDLIGEPGSKLPPLDHNT